jgi:hypothetical protein
MNPWLEEYWRDVHASLLVIARGQLNAELPPGLHARVDERLAIDAEEPEGKPHQYVPDVAVTEPWDRPASQVLGKGGVMAMADEPIVVDLGDHVLRHIEIVDSRDHIITAIELLSPSNKGLTDPLRSWAKKRYDYLRGGINLVEIDLLRWGNWVLPDCSLLKPAPEGQICHYVAVTRPPRITQCEFNRMPLREKLKIIRVPLRRTDPDVALDLQSLVDHCYESGRYGEVINYNKPPSPLLPEAEANWAKEILSASKPPT